MILSVCFHPAAANSLPQMPCETLVTPPASAFDSQYRSCGRERSGDGAILSSSFLSNCQIRHGPSRPATSCFGEWQQCPSWSCKPLCTEVQQPAQSVSLWEKAQPELCPQRWAGKNLLHSGAPGEKNNSTKEEACKTVSLLYSTANQGSSPWHQGRVQGSVGL